jgi:hypothetical protein
MMIFVMTLYDYYRVDNIVGLRVGGWMDGWMDG